MLFRSLIKPIDFFELAKSDPNKALIALGTLLATLLTAPRIDRGIVIGLMLSFIAYLLKKYPMYRHINKNEPPVSR